MSSDDITTPKSTAQMQILCALKAIRDDGPKLPHFGICSNVTILRYPSTWATLPTDEVLYELFKKWPKATGNPAFPVPHPHLSPIAAFAEPHLWEGEYGNNRKELLVFMIEQLEKDTK